MHSENARFHVIRDRRKVRTGDMYDVREWIEEQLEEKIGFFVSLQEHFDEEYEVYVHTDNEELGEKELLLLERLGITEDNEECTKALSNYLNYEIKVSHYENN